VDVATQPTGAIDTRQRVGEVIVAGGLGEPMPRFGQPLPRMSISIQSFVRSHMNRKNFIEFRFRRSFRRRGMISRWSKAVGRGYIMQSCPG
jgi:hypothetical protein